MNASMKCKLLFSVFVLFLTVHTVRAQSDIGVDVVKNFNFGKVAVTGWWGTVSLDVANGNLGRSATGSVELKSSVFHPAEIYIYNTGEGEANVLHIALPGEVILTREGGYTRKIYNITLWPAPPYYNVKNNPKTAYLGGTVGIADYATNPGGIYTGSLQLSVVFE